MTSAENVLGLAEEVLKVDKQDVLTGRVRIRAESEEVQEIEQISLDREAVEVTRVAVNRIISAPPPVRTEGEVTIVPILEEVAVVEKRLLLKEELHIRRSVTTEETHVPVSLRKQHATVERQTLNPPPPQATGENPNG